MENHPEIADAFGVLARSVHTASSLPHRTRELAILRVAATLNADVEWGQHFRDADGNPVYPQREALTGPIASAGAAGSVPLEKARFA